MDRIALCGVFDIPNYGDHLFPLILKSELHKRGCDFEVVLFSPFEAKESFVEDSHVYSLDKMEQMHQEKPFRAIIVGGGEIIHWHRYPQKRSFTSSSFENYPMDKIWIIPFFMKVKYGIPLLWNAPGIPYDFNLVKESANLLFSNIDYLSVRNAFSKQVLLDCGIPQETVHLVPDTGFALTSIETPDKLKAIRHELKLDTKKYVVFHCNRFITNEDVSAVIDVLNSLNKRGYEIYLLPLAYTHNDDSKLKEIQDKSGSRFLMPKIPLSLIQIISVLSGCAAYIGTSLHGTVTASVFGRKVISFDYQKTKKTKDLYNILGYSDYYITDGSQLASTVEKAFLEQKPADFSDIQAKLKKHFDIITSILMDPHAKPNPSSQATNFSDLAHYYFSNTYECAGLRERVKELTEALDTNINFVNVFKIQKSHLEAEKEQLKQEKEKLEREKEQLEIAYQKTLRYRLSAVKRFISSNHS